MAITTRHTTVRLSTYLWGSFDTGSMYTHSLLLKVPSIQGFWDWEQREIVAYFEQWTAADDPPVCIYVFIMFGFNNFKLLSKMFPEDIKNNASLYSNCMLVETVLTFYPLSISIVSQRQGEQFKRTWVYIESGKSRACNPLIQDLVYENQKDWKV